MGALHCFLPPDAENRCYATAVYVHQRRLQRLLGRLYLYYRRSVCRESIHLYVSPPTSDEHKTLVFPVFSWRLGKCGNQLQSTLRSSKFKVFIKSIITNVCAQMRDYDNVICLFLSTLLAQHRTGALWIFAVYLSTYCHS